MITKIQVGALAPNVTGNIKTHVTCVWDCSGCSALMDVE